MAAKSDKGKSTPKKSAPKIADETTKKTSSKSKKREEEEDDEDGELEEGDTPVAKKSVKAGAKPKEEGEEDEDEEGDEPDEVDDWDKVEEEEEWDPDFDEFDIPKSKVKKASTGTAKKGGKGEEEEEFGFVDDEFKDMDLFNDSEEEDDDF